jgi:hypothetical protein
MDRLKVLYLGFTKGNRHLTLKKNLAYCLANAIELDQIIIEDTTKLDFKELLNLKKNIKNISILFVNDSKDFAPNELMAKTAYLEFSEYASVVEISKEGDHPFPKLMTSAGSILTQYEKALKILSKTGESNLDNMLGYRMEGDKIIIHEQEARAVKAIFKQHIVDGRNLSQVLEFCKRYNIRQPNNAQMTMKYLDKIFQRMNCYVGLDKLPNNEMIGNIYKPILTEQVYKDYFICSWSLETKEWKDHKKQFKSKKSFKEFSWEGL